MGGGDALHCCYREQFTYALYARFATPKLYKYAVSGDWDLIPARCRTHPKEATFVHKYAPNDTPLHRLLRQSSDCIHYCPSADDTTRTCLEVWKRDAVQALLEAYPPAASITDALGRTPLHLACMGIDDDDTIASTDRSSNGESSESASISMALLIAQANPKAASIPDKVDGRTPLHYLVARCEKCIPIPLLQQLMEYGGPAALQWRDVTRETPLDIVERRRDELQNAHVVLKLLKDSSSAHSSPQHSPPRH